MSPLRTAVATEAKRIQLQIDADPRLAAAAGGAAHYLGAAAGLEEASLDQSFGGLEGLRCDCQADWQRHRQMEPLGIEA